MAFIADYQGQRVLYKNQYCRITDVKVNKNFMVDVTYEIYQNNPNEVDEQPHEIKLISFDGSDYTGINPFAYSYEKTKHQFMIVQDNV